MAVAVRPGDKNSVAAVHVNRAIWARDTIDADGCAVRRSDGRGYDGWGIWVGQSPKAKNGVR